MELQVSYYDLLIVACIIDEEIDVLTSFGVLLCY
jgi:hypothetical protein